MLCSDKRVYCCEDERKWSNIKLHLRLQLKKKKNKSETNETTNTGKHTLVQTCSMCMICSAAFVFPFAIVSSIEWVHRRLFCLFFFPLFVSNLKIDYIFVFFGAFVFRGTASVFSYSESEKRKNKICINESGNKHLIDNNVHCALRACVWESDSSAISMEIMYMHSDSQRFPVKRKIDVVSSTRSLSVFSNNARIWDEYANARWSTLSTTDPVHTTYYSTHANFLIVLRFICSLDRISRIHMVRLLQLLNLYASWTNSIISLFAVESVEAPYALYLINAK